MTTTFRLQASELDQSFLDRVKAMFREKQIAIVVYEQGGQAGSREIGSSLGLPAGMKTQDLRKFAGSIPDAEAEEMRRAIEEDCEQIDPSTW